MVKIFIGVIVVCVVTFIVFQFIDPNVINQTVSNTQSVNIEDGLSVSISGEISKAGTYLIAYDSTLGDLLSVAGNVTSNADELAYDESYSLKDGLSFYIAPKYDHSDICSFEPIEKICINTADYDELQEIDGIGGTIATSIIEYRTSETLFYRIEDIMNVSGIGNATFGKIKNSITLRTE